MQIDIDGVIGLDVTARDIRSRLGDEDVELLVNSPGGSAYEGIAIFNALREHNRNGHRLTARIVGMAASAASYIPLAADRIVVEDNVEYMIHNPWGIALGDHNALRKRADHMDAMARIFARTYAGRSGFSEDEIRQMMDTETSWFGADIVAAGFADEIEPAGGGAENEDEAYAMATEAVEEARRRLREAEAETEDESVAAMIRAEIQTESAGVTGENNDEARPQAGNREVQEMNLEQLKSEYPDLYKAVKAEGRDEERARMIELDGYVEAHKENAFVAEVVAEAKASGKTAWEVNAKMTAAIEKGRGLDGENPPSVQTKADPADKLTAEDREAAKMMGMSIEEYIKYSGGDA